MIMTLEDYKRENFSQAQEEAGAAVMSAVEHLCTEFGLGPESTSDILQYSIRALNAAVELHISSVRGRTAS